MRPTEGLPRGSVLEYDSRYPSVCFFPDGGAMATDATGVWRSVGEVFGLGPCDWCGESNDVGDFDPECEECARSYESAVRVAVENDGWSFHSGDSL